MSLYKSGFLLKFLDAKNQPEEIKDYIEIENRLLLKYVKSGSRLVDFGCGFGRHLKLLTNKLIYGLGIDIVAENIKIGKENLREYENLELIVGDARHIGLKEKSYDYAICMNNALGNIEEKEAVISEMKRVIVDNGSILLGVYSENSIEARKKWYKNIGLVTEQITEDYFLTIEGFKSEHFSKEKLNRWLDKCHLENIAGIGYFVIS